MDEYCFVAPIVAGGMEVMDNWIKNDIFNSPDHDRVFGEAGITREQVWVQQTPMGDFAVVSFTTDDPEKALRFLSTSKDPWAAKFRAFALKVHGIDLSQPLPMNKQVVDWNKMERT